MARRFGSKVLVFRRSFIRGPVTCGDGFRPLESTNACLRLGSGGRLFWLCVVRGALKINEGARLAADDPCVVSRRDRRRVTGTKRMLGAVVHSDDHLARL